MFLPMPKPIYDIQPIHLEGVHPNGRDANAAYALFG
jgi:hypothetical protein